MRYDEAERIIRECHAAVSAGCGGGRMIAVTWASPNMNQSISLNLPYDLDDFEWAKVKTVYETMDAWVPGQELPCWFGPLGSSMYLCASSEPSGLLLKEM